jgi:hypothetical protein
MKRALPCVAMLSLALITGCSGDPKAGAPAADGKSSAPASTQDSGQGAARAAGDPQIEGEEIAPVSNAGTNPEFDEINAQEVKVQNMIADCMKKEGFQYIPHPMVYGGGAGDLLPRYTLRASLLEPEGTVRAWRQKYGFGRYSQLVFPNDPQVNPPESAPNPNDAIVDGLDDARRKAYQVALDGQEGGGIAVGKPSASDLLAINNSCRGKAGKEFDGDTAETPAKQKKEAADRRLYRKFQTDPAVVTAAADYAKCLRGRGFRPERTQPGSIETALIDDAREPSEGISAAAAKRGLAKEVKAALADLDCRTSYATIMRTKYPAVASIFIGLG